jgi:hypothetical protein
VAQHVEREPDILGPRVECARSHRVNGELDIRLYVLATEELPIGFVVDNLNRLGVDAVDSVDIAERLI